MDSPEPASTAPTASTAAAGDVVDADVVDAALFRDVVDVHTARTGLDRALLAALTSPGLGEPELARVVALSNGPQMRRGKAAWKRLQDAAGLSAVAPEAS